VQTLQVKRRLASTAKNAHGVPIYTYAEPVDWPVYSLAPGAQPENTAGNRDLTVVAWTVYAPPSANAPTELDLVVVDGKDFPVLGRPADWSRSPVPHPTAGDVVELKRTDG
jgi:hypothetical protein